jgi:hypothetical protein
MTPDFEISRDSLAGLPPLQGLAPAKHAIIDVAETFGAHETAPETT